VTRRFHGVHVFAASWPIWDQFKNLIFAALTYLYSLTGDWGVAIILLTIGIRILILPLTIKQTASMYEMQKIQPKIKALQAKYKDDKEKLQEETLKFYSENKVNPLGGCLPLLLQMPVFFALFQVLRTQLPAGASFLGIIPNLSLMPKQVYSAAAAAGGGPMAGIIAALPYIVLVILFSVSIWLPQALMPGDKQQKQIGAYMAIAMLWFGWSSPAGVLLYWDVSSIWGVGQQQLTMTWMNRKKAADELAEKAEKDSAKTASEQVSSKKPSNKQAKKS
jgi:YidC/Oxa1 family membrane protein insertase